ncbi:hypothetical protein OHA01_26400 [Micromonospora zamorensis]|uniref:hypothetical protein n=1 Tax=Micromonospora zamorensis TaxID=709883 RepID=UPI0038680192|nr:hypothetical protein OHA01_26400 [Micromonospora zamorensis]
MWPDDRDLPIDVDAAFGADVAADPGTWSWTSLSSRLRADPIRLRAGKSGPNAQVSPGTCTVALVNDDAALTPLHPISPYWPNVELGTPLRVRLRRVEDAFGRTTSGNQWGTADSGEAWSVGGTGASVSAGVARHSHTDVGNVRVATQPVSLTDSEQVADIAPSALLTGSALVTGFVFRYSGGAAFYWLRAEFNAGGTAVALKITRYTTAGGYVDLATLSPVPGLTYAANGYLRVRASVVGTRLAIKAWPAAGTEPAGWQLTATDSVITAPGKVGLQSWLVAGNSNTLPVAALHKNYTAYVDRFSGHADQWEPTYIPTGVTGQMASAVRITASGILRRLQQGSPPSLSPMRRTLAASSPVAYWPGEDGDIASQSGSAIPGHPPLSVAGTVTFAAVDDYSNRLGTTFRYGTSALADLSAGGTISASVPSNVTTSTATRWTVQLAAAPDVTAASADLVLAEITTTGGTFARWQLVQRKATLRTQLVAYTAAGAATVVVDEPSVSSAFGPFDLSVWQSGGTIMAGTTWTGSGHLYTGSTAGTLGGVSGISMNPTRTTQSISLPVGHLAVWATANLPAAALTGFTDAYGTFVRGPLTSFEREAATSRLARLCAEEGVPLDMPGVPADAVVRMGWQPVGTGMDLYRECEQADVGILYERQFGLAYLPRAYRYNRPADLTIDLATYAITGRADPLTPVYDDQALRNRWTVERTDGSFVVEADTASQRRGVYPDEVELNLLADSQLPDQASWRVHLTSEPDLREATFPIDLAANPGLLDGWLSCQVGSRIVRTNPPAQHRPGPLDRLVMGWTETIGPRAWQVQVVPEPAGPWDVAAADGDQRVAADGATLAVDVSSSGTTLLVSSTAENGPWTQDGADFPLPVRVGGEQVTASAIGPALLDPFTRTTFPGWGGAWTTTGGAASEWSTDGTKAAVDVASVNVGREATINVSYADAEITVGHLKVGTPPTGANVELSLRARYVDPSNFVEARLFVNPDASVTINVRQVLAGVETYSAFPGVSGATATTALAVRLQIDGPTLRARAWDKATPEPPAWQVSMPVNMRAPGKIMFRAARSAGNTNGGSYFVEFDDFAITNPQQVTLSARGVNGVQRAWPAGTKVDVWHPAIVPL